MEDLPFLIEHFIARFNLLQDKAVTGVSEEVLSGLMSYDFPGNVRELENMIERAFVLCHSGQLQPWHLSDMVASTEVSRAPGRGGLAQLEAAFLMAALRRNHWSRIETARQLGIHKTTLFRKIKAFGLEVPARAGGKASWQDSQR
jgi:DNA-binding NtrC family response regulator